MTVTTGGRGSRSASLSSTGRAGGFSGATSAGLGGPPPSAPPPGRRPAEAARPPPRLELLAPLGLMTLPSLSRRLAARWLVWQARGERFQGCPAFLGPSCSPGPRK